MVRAGQFPEVLAKKFERTAHAIRLWVAHADRDAGKRESPGEPIGRRRVARLLTESA